VHEDENERLFDEADAAWDRADLHQAFRLFREAAQNGHQYSQNNLGVFYECGYGTRRNYHKAMFWYRRSAHYYNSCPIQNIADLYRKTGRHGMALQWFERAVRLDSGDGDACLELAKFYIDMGRSTGKKVRRLLILASSSKNITPNGREEAEKLLRCL
jgi:TPR repeat protein